ncbi:MAG: hypothetical protein V3U60_12015 [Gammaproteobacteria bacterium]
MTERRAYSRHGLSALKARVRVRGFQAIDRRTAAARALLAWRAELIADLGGEEAISTQQRTLVELATRTKLYVDSLDAWIMEHGNLMNARKRAVLPVVKDRMQLADALARYLAALGLQRRTKQVQDLGSYLAGKKGGA